MSSSFAIIAQHISDLLNADIEEIIDHRLFHHEPWCNGVSTTADGRFQYRCTDCGYIGELSLTAILYKISEPHLRNIPRYARDWLCAWEVIREIKGRGLEPLRSFMGHLAALMAEEGHHMRDITRVSPRMVCIAALQTIEAIDQAGYVVGKAAQ